MKGWSYDGQCAAILGLTDEAKRQMLCKVGNSNPNYRFPAMWGPNFDWLPDQDHGSNIMLTLQNMLLCRRRGQNTTAAGLAQRMERVLQIARATANGGRGQSEPWPADRAQSDPGQPAQGCGHLRLVE